MDQAKEMVTLSKNITERLKSKKGEITDDEVLPILHPISSSLQKLLPSSDHQIQVISAVAWCQARQFEERMISLGSVSLARSIGFSDPVTKASFGTGAAYFEKLAEELTGILLQPLQEAGGTMTLPEAYCRMNR